MRYLFLEHRLRHRFDVETFRQTLGEHLRLWGFAYVLSILGAVMFQSHFAFGLNASPSLPQRFFLIHKGELPQPGDHVAFRWPGGGPYPEGVTFVKIIAGMAGDTVTRADRDFFVNGTHVGQAKAVSRQGVPLEPGPCASPG